VTTFTASERTLRDLGWPAVLSALADRTASVRGRVRALALEFLPTMEAVTASQARIEEARTLLRLGLALPLGGVPDPRDALARAAKAAVLTPEEIRACGEVIRAAAQVRAFLAARLEQVPRLWAIAGGLKDLSPLAKRIDDAFEPSGRLKDTASDALLNYRQRARQLHLQIKDKVEVMLHDADFAVYLQDNYYSVRNDRYVLPIQATYRGKVPGIVHNASQSGQTLFIEPQGLVDLGNELSIAESLALEEERQILAEFSSYLGDHAVDLVEAIDRLADLDLAQAAARLAVVLSAEAPELGPHEAGLDLRETRHPLLVLQHKRVRANAVALEPAQQVLVVSGPNAGGKTVSITTVGLCVLLTRAGLPVPAAARSRLPLYDGLCTAMGDAQDLARDLSTFSAHLTTLKDILDCVGPGWLVIIDEIAADTDPKEGAALATAILSELANVGAQVLVTTHLDEVKALALTDPRFANARMKFDPQTLAPTYELELGAIGVSNAIEIARHVGLPASVIEHARERLSSGGALSLALGRLEAEQAKASEERRALAISREQVGRDTAELAVKLTAAEQARREAEARIRQELAAELEEARASVSRIVAELQAKGNLRLAHGAQVELSHRAEEAAHKSARANALVGAGEVGADATAEGLPLLQGSRVRVLSLNQEGEVLALDEDAAIVALGTLRARIPRTDVMVVKAGRGRVEPARARTRVEDVGARPLVSPEARCDVRGMRADEAVRELELFLDRCSYAGPSLVLVIHGHGTGALKKVVRETLERLPYVASFKPGGSHEGGDGVTVVELKG
jgi:DNA mismatch repair protein MutS2